MRPEHLFSWPILTVLLLPLCLDARAELLLNRLTLPEGFVVQVYAEDMDDARQMALSPNGTLYVGSMRAGKVYALRDEDGDGRAESSFVIAKGLLAPSGIAWGKGDLYVGAMGDLFVLRDVDNRLAHPPAPELVTDVWPDKRHHGWKYLGFGPDGGLYVPVGAPCNICLSKNPLFAALHRYDLATGKIETIASGIRNTVGFDWHPQTGEIWFTDNGRDLLGDDVPPEEVNVVTSAGQHFGYPFVHGSDILDPKFGTGHNPQDYQAPRLNLQAHSAALGIEFYTGKQFPPRYQNALFIAQHGSWNRSSKVGYQVLVVYLDGDRVLGHETFVGGWLRGQRNWGRPNDVLMAPDGSLLISDDQGDAIYRVSYRK